MTRLLQRHATCLRVLHSHAQLFANRFSGVKTHVLHEAINVFDDIVIDVSGLLLRIPFPHPPTKGDDVPFTTRPL